MSKVITVSRSIFCLICNNYGCLYSGFESMMFFNRLTTVFVDTWLSKRKHPRKRFQNFRQSCVLSTDRIEIHQSQPLVWPSDLLYVMLAGCDWWISIRSVDNMHDWRKLWKRFRGCFVFESRVSMKTVVIAFTYMYEYTASNVFTKTLMLDSLDFISSELLGSVYCFSISIASFCFLKKWHA